MTIEKLRQIADKANDLPNAVIEYSCELPEHKEITKESIFGIKAVFNKDVPKSTGAIIINKY